jgi:hypothetical protein
MRGFGAGDVLHLLLDSDADTLTVKRSSTLLGVAVTSGLVGDLCWVCPAVRLAPRCGPGRWTRRSSEPSQVALKAHDVCSKLHQVLCLSDTRMVFIGCRHTLAAFDAPPPRVVRRDYL